jgi:arylsulfatase A-like enzyme
VESSRIYYNAYSTSCWTSAAHASLFTGLYPIIHKTTQENWAMSDQLTTLAEIFSVHGYGTIGITENAMLNKNNNFNQGFSEYHETWREEKNLSYRDENIAFTLLKKFLNREDPKKPFFAFINFIEPHSPYNSSEQFYFQFLSDPSIGCVSSRWRDYFLKKTSFTRDELEHLKELYDAEIRYVDFWIGKIIDELKTKKLWDNTIFIITSDHGENFGNHQMMDHVFSLYESTVKIPLIIHYPEAFSGGSEDYTPVQLTDLFSTLLTLSGIGTKEYLSQGHDLSSPGQREEQTIFCEYYYPQQALQCFSKQDGQNQGLDKFRRRLKAVISDKMKLIWGSDGVHELYDLARDPHEEEDLIDDVAYLKTKQEMLKLLEDKVNHYDQMGSVYFSSSLPSPNEGIDEETKDALKSLGYVR